MVRASFRGRLRIAQVSTPFVPVPPPRYGGTELIVSELVNGLGALGHEVVLFATGDSRPRCELRAIHERAVWPPEEKAELAHAAWAAEQIRASRFDVVHAHVPSFLAFASQLDVPVVYTLHHDRTPALSDFYAKVTGDIHYVGISAHQARLHPELKPMSVVHHGLDPELYPLGLRGRGHLAFLGRLSEVKGPDTAIAVAARVGKELHMAGGLHAIDGTAFNEILEPMLRQPHVRRLGELSHVPKVRLLAEADALLFPIRWNEPFGLVMIEAMLCGCPVVAFRGGSVEEVVEPGITGFLASDEEEMARLVEEEVPRLDRAAIRRRAVERFSTARMVEGYLRTYVGAMARRTVGQLFEVAEGAHP